MIKLIILIILFLLNSPILAQQIYPFPQDGKWGYINADGTVAVQPIYESAKKFSDGMGRVAYINDRDEYLYGFVNEEGREVIPAKFNTVSDFSNGLARVQIRGRYMYLLKNGTIVTKNSFDQIYPATNGMSLFKQDEFYGYVGTNGQIAIKPIFTQAFNFSDERALVSTNTGRKKKYGFIDKIGNFIVEPMYDQAKSFKYGFAAVADYRDWFIVDVNGNFVSDNSFDNVGTFSDGLINVKIKNRWGFINSVGEIIIVPTYKFADQFSKGLAIVSDGDFFGYINTSGEQIVPYDFTRVTRFDGRLARVSKFNNNGFMNATGQYNVTDKITSIGSFHSERARMRVGAYYGYYGQDAKLAIKPSLLYASDFEGDLAITITPITGGYKTAYINRFGKEVKSWEVISKPILKNKDVFYSIVYPSLPFYRDSDPSSRIIIRANYGDQFIKSYQRTATPIIGHGLNGLLYMAEYFARPGYIFSEAVSSFSPPKIGMGITQYFREKFGVISETGSPIAYNKPMNTIFFNGSTLNRTIVRSVVEDEYFIPFMKVSESLFLFAAALGYPISEYPEYRSGTLPNFLSASIIVRFSGSRNSDNLPTSYTLTIEREKVSVRQDNYGIRMIHTYTKPKVFEIPKSVEPIFETKATRKEELVEEFNNTNGMLQQQITNIPSQTELIIEQVTNTNTIDLTDAVINDALDNISTIDETVIREENFVKPVTN